MKELAWRKPGLKSNGGVSIIMLTHNAPEYVKLSLETLKKTECDIPLEVIVVDNASESETQQLLLDLKGRGYIQKLLLLDKNLFFAKGNNLGSKLVSKDSRYILLLNSDIEIIDSKWLSKMLAIHKRGATSLGCGTSEQGRFIADGYCILIDRDIFDKILINENFEWWYGLAYTEKEMLRRFYTIQAVRSHDELLVHFGGKSGNDWEKAAGMERINWYDKWFGKCLKQVKCIYSLSKELGSDFKSINFLRGMCEDHWCLKVLDFQIKTGTKGTIKILGYYPKEITDKLKGHIYVDKKYKQEFKICSAKFELEIKCKPNSVQRIWLKSDFGFQAPQPDIRYLCFIVDDIWGE